MENTNETVASVTDKTDAESVNCNSGSESDDRGASCSYQTPLNRTRSTNRQRLVAHSTAMESIQAESDPIDEVGNLPLVITAQFSHFVYIHIYVF